MKTTDWIDGSVQPVRAGVYERVGHSGGVTYSHWSGGYWGKSSFLPIYAYAHRFDPSQFQNVNWRGLAEKP